VAARSTGLGDLGRAAPRPLAEGELAADAGLRQPVVFDGEPVDALVVRRDDLPAGSRLSGPAVVVEPTATTVVPPGMTLEVDRYGSLVIHADAQEARS
jgi:N-methylhydantoinase A